MQEELVWIETASAFQTSGPMQFVPRTALLSVTIPGIP